jgi:hypothetical protein
VETDKRVRIFPSAIEGPFCNGDALNSMKLDSPLGLGAFKKQAIYGFVDFN